MKKKTLNLIEFNKIYFVSIKARVVVSSLVNLYVCVDHHLRQA
jgi:hypothetical protein